MEFSKLLNIKLVKIPEGATEQLQTPDFNVFGVLKKPIIWIFNCKNEKGCIRAF